MSPAAHRSTRRAPRRPRPRARLLAALVLLALVVVVTAACESFPDGGPGRTGRDHTPPPTLSASPTTAARPARLSELFADDPILAAAAPGLLDSDLDRLPLPCGVAAIAQAGVLLELTHPDDASFVTLARTLRQRLVEQAPPELVDPLTAMDAKTRAGAERMRGVVPEGASPAEAVAAFRGPATEVLGSMSDELDEVMAWFRGSCAEPASAAG